MYLGVLLIVLAWLLTIFSLRGIRVERKARSLRAAVGDIFEEHYEIINSSFIPKLWLEISNDTTIPHATGSRVLTLLRGRQKRSYTARTWLTSRGGFLLGPTTVTSGDPFGIFRVSKSFPAVDSLVVLSMLVNVTDNSRRNWPHYNVAVPRATAGPASRRPTAKQCVVPARGRSLRRCAW